MSRFEPLRIAIVFAALGLLGVAVLWRLVDLQILHGTGPRAALAKQKVDLPAPRGGLFDRFGGQLAWDRPVYEGRVTAADFADLWTKADAPAPDPARVQRARDRLVADLMWALTKAESQRPAAVADRLRVTLRARVDRAIERAITRRKSSVDVLVDHDVDDPAVIEALRQLDTRYAARAPRGEEVAFHPYFDFQPRWEREYGVGDALTGLVGRVQPGPLRIADATGVARLVDDRLPVSGLERLRALIPGDPGYAALCADAHSRTYWTAERVEPDAPVGLHTTVDPSLQARADDEIATAAEAIRAHYGTPPEWGALVLVDVRDGALVAAASYTAGKDGNRDRNGAFAPAQRLFEPGSVVKPLHISMLYERGLVDWSREVDCRRGYLAGSDIAAPGTRLPRREIKDEHPSDMLLPRDVLVRSSNIGAVRLGLRLGAQGIEDYLQAYRFAERTASCYPGELAGTRPGPIPSLSMAERLAYAGPSVLFGYQISVTPLQLTRAYLSFLSGRPRELRLIDAVERDGKLEKVPSESDGEAFLSMSTMAEIRAALVGVVEDEHGTARNVGKWLRDLRTRTGRTDLVLAGKTGTSQYVGNATKWDGSKFHGDIRTASFAGFTPVDSPRFLAVCVFQKAGAGAFFGGTYAAPAASRLLVAALDREQTAWRTMPSDGSASDDIAIGPEPGGSGQLQRR